jgi:hypothetical protein
MAKKKKKKKKATRCTRKTKAGKRCKAIALAGRKTCVSHGPKRKKKKAAKKAKSRKAAKKPSAPRTRCSRKTKAGVRCKAMALAGSRDCAAHKGKKRAKKRVHPDNPCPSLPWPWK